MKVAAATVAFLAIAQPVYAQEPAGFEFGLRYWWSRGYHQFSHNASGVSSALGNPTSILTYEDADANAAEIFGRGDLGNGWFVRGNAGAGEVYRGSFDDEDYAAGQIKFSDTTSSIRGDRLDYFTLEGGRELWRNAGTATRLEVFVGYQEWSETLEAYGARASVGTTSVPGRVRVITNEVRWRSLRAGLGLRSQLAPRTRLSVNLGLVPYSELHNEDSHHLRADLGPTPNVITTGTGAGVQLDADLRHVVYKRLELGVGLRYWHLRSTDADVTLAGATVPVNEIETRRAGLIVSLSQRW